MFVISNLFIAPRRRNCSHTKNINFPLILRAINTKRNIRKIHSTNNKMQQKYFRFTANRGKIDFLLPSYAMAKRSHSLVYRHRFRTQTDQTTTTTTLRFTKDTLFETTTGVARVDYNILQSQLLCNLIAKIIFALLKKKLSDAHNMHLQ